MAARESGYYWARNRADGRLIVIHVWDCEGVMVVTFCGAPYCPTVSEVEGRLIDIVQRIPEPTA